MRWKIIAVAAVLLLSASVLTLSGPADAEGGGTVSDGSTWYCYGDRPTFLFPSYSEGVNVGWSVTDADDGGTLEPVETSEDGSRITVDLSGHDMVHVTQTVSAGDGPSLSMTIHVIALHLPEDTVYTVRFHDGGRVADTQYIDGSTVVEAGMGHVVPPLIEKGLLLHALRQRVSVAGAQQQQADQQGQQAAPPEFFHLIPSFSLPAGQGNKKPPLTKVRGG